MGHTFQDIYGGSCGPSGATECTKESGMDTVDDPELDFTNENNIHETRGQKEWVKKCVSSFSLYAKLAGDKVSDPYEQLDSIEAGEYKPILSKSAKKRLRKSRCKARTLEILYKAKTAQMKRISRTAMQKRKKKEMRKVIDQLSKM